MGHLESTTWRFFGGGFPTNRAGREVAIFFEEISDVRRVFFFGKMVRLFLLQ